jgi:renilla-luciferin 2-monooxygenase
VVVLPLRHPLDTAKAATSVDQLSDGRFLLGVATGDRAVEFPAYNIDYQTRGARFRDTLAYLRTATERRFPLISSSLGTMEGTDLLPKPLHGRLPIFVTGRSQQQIEWIADNADGWLFYTLPFEKQAFNVQRWRRLTKRDDGVFKPFAQATYLDLVENPQQRPRSIHQGISIGREPLLELLQHWQGIGIDQLMFNFKQSRRPVADVMAEMAEYVLPHFPPGDQERG